MVLASVLAQLPLSLWWTRHFWFYSALSTKVSARLWVANYLSAFVVLIGLPVCTLLGGFAGGRQLAHGRKRHAL